MFKEIWVSHFYDCSFCLVGLRFSNTLLDFQNSQYVWSHQVPPSPWTPLQHKHGKNSVSLRFEWLHLPFKYSLSISSFQHNSVCCINEMLPKVTYAYKNSKVRTQTEYYVILTLIWNKQVWGLPNPVDLGVALCIHPFLTEKPDHAKQPGSYSFMKSEQPKWYSLLP